MKCNNTINSVNLHKNAQRWLNSMKKWDKIENKCKTCVVRVRKFTDTKAVNKEGTLKKVW